MTKYGDHWQHRVQGTSARAWAKQSTREGTRATEFKDYCLSNLMATAAPARRAKLRIELADWMCKRVG